MYGNAVIQPSALYAITKTISKWKKSKRGNEGERVALSQGDTLHLYDDNDVPWKRRGEESATSCDRHSAGMNESINEK